jgi:hypothetical protein
VVSRLLKAYRDRKRKQVTESEYATERKNTNALFARVFNSHEGQKVLEHLICLNMAVPMAQLGDDLLTIGERQGRSNLVNEIIQRIENSRQGD